MRNPKILIAVGAAIVLVALLVVVTRSASTSTSIAAGTTGSTTPLASAPESSTVVPGTTTASATSPTSAPPNVQTPVPTVATTPPPISAPPSAPPPSAPVSVPTTRTGVYGADHIPLTVSVPPLSGVHDGQEIPIKVLSQPGSSAYGFDAFLCKGGTSYTTDADVRPTETGKCVSKPLSANSDRYKEVAAAPPYQRVEGSFRVGVGTDTFKSMVGDATVTCGPGNPCTLVLKVQFPNGYGFLQYPIVYG